MGLIITQRAVFTQDIVDITPCSETNLYIVNESIGDQQYFTAATAASLAPYINVWPCVKCAWLDNLANVMRTVDAKHSVSSMRERHMQRDHGQVV